MYLQSMLLLPAFANPLSLSLTTSLLLRYRNSPAEGLDLETYPTPMPESGRFTLSALSVTMETKTICVGYSTPTNSMLCF